MRDMELSLGAFQLGDLQTFKTIILTLEMDGRTVDEAMLYIEELTQVEEMKLIPSNSDSKVGRECPDCGGLLTLGAVGPNPKGWQHQWFCPDDDCTFIDELGKESVQEVLNSMVGEFHDNY